MKYQDLELFIKELENKESSEFKYYQGLAEILEKIVGSETFRQLKEYFKNIVYGKDDIIILMARRCLTIYQLFLIFILIDAINDESLDSLKEQITSKQIYSDVYLPMLTKDALEGKNIRIVDDILIHGRSVKNIYKYLENQFSNDYSSLRVSIFLYNVDCECLNSKIKSRIDKVRTCHRNEWQSLSRQLVECIQKSIIPYTSFISSGIEFSGDSLEKILENKYNYRFTSNLNEKAGESVLYFYPDSFFPKEIGKWIYGGSIRTYKSEYNEINNFTAIPYIFFKEIESKDFLNFLKDLKKPLYLDQFSFFKDIFDLEFIKEDLKVFCLKVLTAWTSLLLVNTLIQKNNQNDFFFEFDTLEKAFGTEITNEIKQLIEKNLSFQDIEYVKPRINLNEKEDQFNINNSIEKLKEYFLDKWFEDENLAYLGMVELSDEISINQLLKKIESNQNSKDIKYLRIISLLNLQLLWDQDIASASYKSRSNQLGCFNKQGERSYRTLIDKCPYIITCLYTLQENLPSFDSRTGKKFSKSRIDFLLELLDSFKDEIDLGETAYKILKSGIKEGNLCAFSTEPNIYKNALNDPNSLIGEKIVGKKLKQSKSENNVYN